MNSWLANYKTYIILFKLYTLNIPYCIKISYIHNKNHKSNYLMFVYIMLEVYTQIESQEINTKVFIAFAYIRICIHNCVSIHMPNGLAKI